MLPAPIGSRIRVIANSNGHDYEIGEVYTVSQVDDDGTFQAKDDDGDTHGWLRWEDCAPVTSIGWAFCQRVLPPDIVRFLAAFDGVEHLALKDEIKDRILLCLPDLHQRILDAMEQGGTED